MLSPSLLSAECYSHFFFLVYLKTLTFELIGVYVDFSKSLGYDPRATGD